MAWSRDATDPSWKYGPVIAMFRNDGTLKTWRSASSPVTSKRPASSVAYGVTSPSLRYMPPPMVGPV
jgi:hypothetical protein